MPYRDLIKNSNLIFYKLKVKESDIAIYTEKKLYKKAKLFLLEARRNIDSYIKMRPEFLESFKPLKLDKNASPIIKSMLRSAKNANVGPMASVAGAISEYIGRGLLSLSPEVIIENGGDIFLKSDKERMVGIFSGKSPFSNKIALILPKSKRPYGICTSSGTVGHSFSYGISDAATIVSYDCAYSDAWATRIANMIKNDSDIQQAIKLIKKQPKILGGAVIKGRKMAVTGKIRLKNI